MKSESELAAKPLFPAIGPPDQHGVDLPALRSFQQFLPQLSPGCTGADLLHLQGDGPAAPGGMLAHCTILHGQCLLVGGGNTRIETRTDRFSCPLSLAKNPSGFLDPGHLFDGPCKMLSAHGHRLSFSAPRRAASSALFSPAATDVLPSTHHVGEPTPPQPATAFPAASSDRVLRNPSNCRCNCPIAPGMGVAVLLFNLRRPRRLIEVSNLTQTTSRTLAKKLTSRRRCAMIASHLARVDKPR